MIKEILETQIEKITKEKTEIMYDETGAGGIIFGGGGCGNKRNVNKAEEDTAERKNH